MTTRCALSVVISANRRPDGLTLIGDGQQAIYPGGFSLAEAGISVAGRGVVLSTDYRNTREIATFAASIVEGDEFVDIKGGPRAGGCCGRRSPYRPVARARVVLVARCARCRAGRSGSLAGCVGRRARELHGRLSPTHQGQNDKARQGPRVQAAAAHAVRWVAAFPRRLGSRRGRARTARDRAA